MSDGKGPSRGGGGLEGGSLDWNVPTSVGTSLPRSSHRCSTRHSAHWGVASGINSSFVAIGRHFFGVSSPAWIVLIIVDLIYHRC